jgi:hypothetical protein
MTNDHLTPPENDVTPGPERQRAARSRPCVRRLAFIENDGSRFRLVPGPWGRQRREMQG